MGRSKYIAMLLCLVLTVCLLAPAALAAGAEEHGKPVSLTLTFQPEGRPAPGVTFRVYRVAEVEAGVVCQALPPFDSWPIQITGLEQKDWPALASTLEVYVTTRKPEPTARAVTDSQGKAVFSGLESGFYLVTGDPFQRGDTIYEPLPVMLYLPGFQNGRWIYDVDANVKYDQVPEGSGDSITEIKVVKIWANQEGEELPRQVTVQLLKDGEVWDTVTLSADNNWQHTWSRLKENGHWQVTEPEVPGGYGVTIVQEGDIFLVTNTRKKEEPPGDDTPPGGDIPPGTDTPPGGEKPPGEEKLPQTGMLWWPVPVLAVSGMGCFLAGWVKERKEQNDEE